MSIHEVRVYEEFDDPRAREVTRQARLEDLETNLRTSRVFYIEGVTDEEADILARELLSDPVTQHAEVNRRDDWDDKSHVEVAPLPGVTNRETESIKFGASLLGIEPTDVESGTEYHFAESNNVSTREQVVGRILMNTKIEQVRTKAPETLRISGEKGIIETIEIRNLTDEQLEELSKIRKTALNLDEMRRIQAEARKMGRDITDGELKYMGGRWSEHCCHKTTNADLLTKDGMQPSIFSTIKTCSIPYFEIRGVSSAYGDNSGVVNTYNGWAFNIKLETHNSPRNIDPFGGSGTGTGGVLRDINETGTGARVISSMHMDFTAPPNMPNSEVLPGTLHPRQLLTGSVKGVGSYGNPMGVPTNNGSFHVHPNYRGKSSILVGSIGVLREKDSQKGIPIHGDLVVATGGKTGRDGIDGATFSSISADGSTAEVHAGAVQIGDPITEKKMFDAINEASRRGLIRAMTDCGAAGFASAIGELGEDIGVKIDLIDAPLKYTGLKPWEIWISESQERSVLAIDPANIEEIKAIFTEYGSEATVLGVFGTEGDEPRLEVNYDGESLVNLSYDFIINGLGKLVLEAEWTPLEIKEKKPRSILFSKTMDKIMSDWNVCSKEPIVRQYDQEVQGMSAIKSYDGVHGDGPNDAAILRPILNEPWGIVQAHGCNPSLTELDPERGSIWAYVEGMSNFVAAGGNPDDAVIVNNYISATPTKRVMGALYESVHALAKCVHEFKSPIISGKDSLSSTYTMPDGSALESPYNLIITVAGKIPDVEKTVSTDIKKHGSTLVMIGKQDLNSFGGSVYYEQLDGQSRSVPKIDLPTFHSTATALHSAIQEGKVLSAHDISEGGLAVALSEMLFGGDCGAVITLRDKKHTVEQLFFNETAGCFVVEVEDRQTARELFGNIPHKIIGKTIKDKIIRIKKDQEELPELSVDRLKHVWKNPLNEVLA